MENLTWKQRLNRAEIEGVFTVEDKDLSSSWSKCAIGERLDLVSYKSVEVKDAIEEIDGEIQAAGMNFYYAVDQDNIDEAKEIYARIQKLSVRQANIILKKRGLK